MYWLWKLLESYNNCTFSTWKDMFLFNLSFWVPNLFCTFHDYGREGTPFLASTDGPSLIFSHSDFWTTFLPCKTALPCPVKHEIFHCVEIFFIFQDFWATCGLPWKTECALNSLYWIYIFLIIQNFEQLAHALKNRVSLKFFTALKYFYLSGFLRNLRLPWQQSLSWNFSLYLICFCIQDDWATVACPERQSVPWIHCIEYVFFIIKNF